MPRSREEYLRAKREGMARLRARDPEAARKKRNAYHALNRKAQTKKMRDYYAKRFFWGRLGTRGLRAQMAEVGWRFVAPLIDHPLMPWDHEPLILGAGLWRQRLALLGFSHSNCGGHCCKGGQGHWKLMLRVFPERYAYVEWREQQIRVVLGDVSMLTDRRKRPGDAATVKRPLTLADLRHRALTAEEADDMGRCSCTFGEAA